MREHEAARGASSVEYALLAAGIAGVLALMIIFFGDNVRDMYDDTCQGVASTATCESD